MEKIYRKDIEAQIRENAKKQMVACPLPEKQEDGTFWSSFEAGVRPLGFASLDSMFRKCTYEEAQKKLKEAFEDAAEKYNLPIEKLIFVKGWGQGSQIQGERLETDEELEERIQRETDTKVDRLRQAKKDRAYEKARKQKQIKKLEEELAKLKK